MPPGIPGTLPMVAVGPSSPKNHGLHAGPMAIYHGHTSSTSLVPGGRDPTAYTKIPSQQEKVLNRAF